ncbi:type III restriction-modification system endonuclease [Selenomonas flueggei]|uniref:type III restriction-modification system endonuclease n=1 Tax=Selenomonas flueggei TaxID=135080 RepID=UPI002671B375|nr:DEAD/DEAH box helicase family protein [Selenomonas flueggei]
MKFHFTVQPYQTDAVEAVVGVFDGQPYAARTTYLRDVGTGAAQGNLLSVQESYMNAPLLTAEADDGFRNEELALTKEQLLANIRRVQSVRNLHLSDTLSAPLGACALDVEMETGTGKTYVYIKTMFELNRRYGWSKFIVVVPSIAIREGVRKSFEMTAEHFMEHYGRKARFFVYSSANLNQLDAFSADAGLSVMIINTQAFAASLNEEKSVEGRGGNKEARIIYSKRDAFGSRRPIDVIAANRPILILDEPQKMGKKGSVTQKALAQFAPLFTLNYSATHAERHNLVYVLDAVDAYNARLVKKIEVKGFEVKNLPGTGHYLYLAEIVLSPKVPPRARIEFEVAQKSGVKRELRIFSERDNLCYLSGGMAQYEGYVVEHIDAATGTVLFLNGTVLHTGDVEGDVSEADLRRVQIRETIVSHFEKEQRLFTRGIKTLSLFFIDEVAKYRQYDADGNAVLGEYGRIFEEEYRAVMNERRDLFDPAYMKYLDDVPAEKVHAGYFSIDKKTGRAVDSSLRRGSDLSDDISAYDLILKDKERLLSFDEPTRVIFSHSALREGWDNPNVFQICTLKHAASVTAKRQEVGRGLRLAVDRSGQRMDRTVLGDAVHEVNVLTVIASESYAGFVGDLQKQMEAELYDCPKTVTEEYFVGKTVKSTDGTAATLDKTQARAMYFYLGMNGYVDVEGHVTEKYRTEHAAGTLAPLPEALIPMTEGVHRLVQAIYDERVLRTMISDAGVTKTPENPLNDRFYRKEFQALWKRINHKYAYTVSFDSRELVRAAIDHINAELRVSRLQYTITYGGQQTDLDAAMVADGTSFSYGKSRTSTLKHAQGSTVTYDLIGRIAAGTTLTRRTVAEILRGIKAEVFAGYRYNPEEFIRTVTRLILEQKATTVIDHITYNMGAGSYDSSIFMTERRPLVEAYEAKRAIQKYLFPDGQVEKRFAQAMDGQEEVLCYAKLPRGFKIPTPVGSYAPDWAIVFHEGTVKHIYFVAETKGSLSTLQQRPIEQAKIACAKRLFEKLNDVVVYECVDDFKTLMNRVMR